MKKLVGYAGFSTRQQSTDRQRDLLAASVRHDTLYIDHGVSGARASGPQFDRALDAQIEGDTLVITTSDRFGRSTQTCSPLQMGSEGGCRPASPESRRRRCRDRDADGVNVGHGHGRPRADGTRHQARTCHGIHQQEKRSREGPWRAAPPGYRKSDSKHCSTGQRWRARSAGLPERYRNVRATFYRRSRELTDQQSDIWRRKKTAIYRCNSHRQFRDVPRPNQCFSHACSQQNAFSPLMSAERSALGLLMRSAALDQNAVRSTPRRMPRCGLPREFPWQKACGLEAP